MPRFIAKSGYGAGAGEQGRRAGDPFKEQVMLKLNKCSSAKPYSFSPHSPSTLLVSPCGDRPPPLLLPPPPPPPSPPRPPRCPPCPRPRCRPTSSQSSAPASEEPPRRSRRRGQRTIRDNSQHSLWDIVALSDFPPVGLTAACPAPPTPTPRTRTDRRTGLGTGATPLEKAAEAEGYDEANMTKQVCTPTIFRRNPKRPRPLLALAAPPSWPRSTRGWRIWTSPGTKKRGKSEDSVIRGFNKK